MTTIFDVRSGACSHGARIEAVIEQNTVRLRITSTCPRVQRYGERLESVNVKDLLKPMSVNPVYTLAHSLTPTCAVPCAVLNACWAEAGLISKNLLKNHPTITIEYKG